MNLYAVGKIIGFFGVKGYLKILPTTHSPKRFKNLSRVYVGNSAEEVLPFTIEEVLLEREPPLVKLREIGNRNSADKFIDQFIFIDETEIVQPKINEYFIHEIIGCEVWSTDGRYIGVIEDVYKLPAQDLWGIRKDEKLQLIPAVKEFIKNVDTKNKKIIVDLIEGLIEE